MYICTTNNIYNVIALLHYLAFLRVKLIFQFYDFKDSNYLNNTKVDN